MCADVKGWMCADVRGWIMCTDVRGMDHVC